MITPLFVHSYEAEHQVSIDAMTHCMCIVYTTECVQDILLHGHVL